MLKQSTYRSFFLCDEHNAELTDRELSKAKCRHFANQAFYELDDFLVFDFSTYTLTPDVNTILNENCMIGSECMFEFGINYV